MANFPGAFINEQQQKALDSIINLPDGAIPKGLGGKLSVSGTNVDAITEKFIFNKSGVFPVNSIEFDLAWKLASAGESVSVENMTTGEFFRLHKYNTTDVSKPDIIVNRVDTGNFTLQPIFTDTLIDPVDTPIIVPALAPILALGPDEDGQAVIYADLKLTAASVKTNITITIKLNGEVFATSFFPVATLIEAPDIYRFIYETPWDVKVGDTLEVTTASPDGPMIFLGRSDTEQKWQRGRVVLWDKKDVSTSVFGDEYEYSSDEVESTTTSTTFQNKLTLITAALPAGDYHISWYCEINNSVAQQNTAARARINGVEVGFFERSSITANSYIAFSGIRKETLTNAAHTLDIEFKNSAGGTAKIRRTRIEIYRII